MTAFRPLPASVISAERVVVRLPSAARPRVKVWTASLSSAGFEAISCAGLSPSRCFALAAHSVSRAAAKRALASASVTVARSVDCGEKLPKSSVDAVSAAGLNTAPGARAVRDELGQRRSATAVSALVTRAGPLVPDSRARRVTTR